MYQHVTSAYHPECLPPSYDLQLSRSILHTRNAVVHASVLYNTQIIIIACYIAHLSWKFNMMQLPQSLINVIISPGSFNHTLTVSGTGHALARVCVFVCVCVCVCMCVCLPDAIQPETVPS